MSDVRILVIEDNQIWWDALTQILQHLNGNVDVVVAANYGDALFYIRNEKYDLIIMDLALNGDPVDYRKADLLGMELLQIVRQSQNNMNCGVIVLSAYGDIGRTKQALRDYGVYDFVEKDKFDSKSFVETVRSTIRDSRLRMAEFKAKRRLRLIIQFNQRRLVSSELIGPGQHAVYSMASQRYFKGADLIRRADKLNIHALNEKPEVWRPEARSIGKIIYDNLSKEESFQNGLIASRALAEHPGNLWLQFSAPAKDLSIPFELLYNGTDYLSLTHIFTRQLLHTGATLSRKTEQFHEFLAGLVKRKQVLRILIVGANVDNTLPATEMETTLLKTMIESDLQALGFEYEVNSLLGTEATYKKVSEALRDGRYHIFHYAGDGLYDETLPEISGLVLHNNRGLRILTAADLNILVRNTQLQMVFLSCCLGARNASHVGHGDFYGMMEAIASADVPIVLGYRWTVLDKAAMHLAQTFYKTLWHTFSPGEALLEARINATLGPKGRDEETWASPVLVMQNT